MINKFIIMPIVNKILAYKWIKEQSTPSHSLTTYKLLSYSCHDLYIDSIIHSLTKTWIQCLMLKHNPVGIDYYEK